MTLFAVNAVAGVLKKKKKLIMYVGMVNAYVQCQVKEMVMVWSVKEDAVVDGVAAILMVWTIVKVVRFELAMVVVVTARVRAETVCVESEDGTPEIT